MNTMTLLSAIALAALPFVAGPAAADNSIEFCTTVSEAAHSAMVLRQTNAPLHQVIGMLSESLSGDELTVATGLMELAYAQPAFSTADYQEQASADFANMAFRVCRER